MRAAHRKIVKTAHKAVRFFVLIAVVVANNQGEALYIINSEGIAYHQNEVLYIIKPTVF